MCSGGGGGSSASTDALNKEQELTLKRNNMRQANDDWARQQAIAKINQLYGVGSTINGETIHEAQTPTYKTVTTLSQKGGGGFNSIQQQVQDGTQSSFFKTPHTELYDASQQLAQRNAGYETVRQNALGLALNDLAEQKTDASRNTRFGLARAGLTGGSVDVDANQNIADRYAKGVLQSNQNADGIVSGVRAKDEAARADLISRINAGMDANSATTSALAQMQNNQAAAKAEGQSTFLNDFFNGIMGGIGSYQFNKGGADFRNSTSQVNNLKYGGRIS